MRVLSLYLSLLTASTAVVTKSGKGTFYEGNVDGGTCMLSGYNLPYGIMGTALSSVNWHSGRNCGACVEVNGPKGKIKAMVVDQCPGCDPNHLDLFPDAFAQLEDPSVGIIKLDWKFVPCTNDGPITLRSKEGASSYWFSMQVVNSNRRIKSLKVSKDGGQSWMDTQRQYYNYFEISGGTGTDTVMVKLEAMNGEELVVRRVPVNGGSEKTATRNF